MRSSRPTKILIADDSRTDQMLLRSTLVNLGYEVEVACDGEQAWQALQRPETPELAVLDWMMPGLSGPEICRRLRARAQGTYVYVILLTALDRLDDLVEGMEAGADDYITKPFKAQELSARLRAGRRILDLQRELLAAHRELEIRASHDGLTGLLNHVAVLERLKVEIDRSERQSASVGAILLDLDHFKMVNDAYGHAVGDHVLKEVSRRLRATVRPYDSVGRYGGEEFLVVAPGCDFQSVVRVAQRLRHEVSVTPIMIAAAGLSVTVSAGVAALTPTLRLDASALIDRADRALYRAKSLGRNRVEWIGEDEPCHSDSSNIGVTR